MIFEFQCHFGAQFHYRCRGRRKCHVTLTLEALDYGARITRNNSNDWLQNENVVFNVGSLGGAGPFATKRFLGPVKIKYFQSPSRSLI